MTGQKFQVISSICKLTNANLCCLNWMHENAKDFVDNRKAFMDETTKLRFFKQLQCMAVSEEPVKASDSVRACENATIR